MPPRRLPVRCRPFAWLLAFALWLPVAQWVAATHVLQHLNAGADEESERPAQLPHVCEICLEAAAISGGAPLPAAVAALPAPAPHALPQVAIADGVTAATQLPYRSRAPPLLHL
jgi:hypothetical protein